MNRYNDIPVLAVKEAAVAANSPEFDAAIPPGLIEEIRAGRCVAFVGSGFSGAAGLPTWEALLIAFSNGSTA
jgi:hypothetical protein